MLTNSRFRTFFLALAILCLSCTLGHAATYYVATTGNNGVSCATAQTIGTPKQTIRNGITCLAAGDTLLVRGGTYPEVLDGTGYLSAYAVTWPSGTSWANAITIAGYPAETVWIQSATATDCRQPVIIWRNAVFVKYIIFDRINVDGGLCQRAGSGGGGGVVIDRDTSFIRWQNSEIKNAGAQMPSQLGSGIYVDATAHHNEFINIDSHHNKSYGSYAGGQDNLYERVTFRENAKYGMQIYADIALAHRNIVRNSRFWGNNTSNGSFGGVFIGSGQGNYFYNNLVYNNTLSGIDTGYGSNDNRFYNNVIYGNTGVCLELYSGATATIARNNICWANGNNNFVNSFSQAWAAQSNNLTTSNPLFVNAGAGDFHLQAGSPAIDAGFDTTVINPTDFEGTTFSIPKEIGAFNYGSVVAPLVMVFTTPPVSTVEDLLIPAITVCVNDTGGVRQTGHTNAISLAIGTNPASGTLTGGGGIVPTNGCSQFSSTSINNPSVNPYTLVASSTGVTSQTSANFLILDDVDPAVTAPARLMLQQAR